MPKIQLNDFRRAVWLMVLPLCSILPQETKAQRYRSASHQHQTPSERYTSRFVSQMMKLEGANFLTEAIRHYRPTLLLKNMEQYPDMMGYFSPHDTTITLDKDINANKKYLAYLHECGHLTQFSNAPQLYKKLFSLKRLQKNFAPFDYLFAHLLIEAHVFAQECALVIESAQTYQDSTLWDAAKGQTGQPFYLLSEYAKALSHAQNSDRSNDSVAYAKECTMMQFFHPKNDMALIYLDFFYDDIQWLGRNHRVTMYQTFTYDDAKALFRQDINEPLFDRLKAGAITLLTSLGYLQGDQFVMNRKEKTLASHRALKK